MRLSDPKVRAMRQLYARGETLKDLAFRYGVTKDKARLIICGQERQEAGGPVSATIRHAGYLNRKIPDEDVRAIREAYAAGEPLSTLSRRYGIGPPMVSLIVRGKRRLEAGGPISPPKGYLWEFKTERNDQC